MITIRNLHDLEPYGFILLTGEACAISARLLVDLTEKGAALFRTFNGLPHDCPLSAPWNHGEGEGAHVASCFIANETFPALIAFVLISQPTVNGIAMSLTDGAIIARETTDEDAIWEANVEYATRQGLLKRFYQIYPAQPRKGLSNVHCFSGRAQ